MIVWIIDDDEEALRLHERSFTKRLPQAVIHTFECLFDAWEFIPQKTPDFIFIDLGGIDGRTLPCFDNHSYIGNLQRFVEYYRSAFIVIMSALVSHAEEDLEDLQEACGDNHLFTLDPCKPYALVDFCSRYRTTGKE